MRKYLLAILMVLMCAGVSQSASVSNIVGIVSQCDTTLPGCTPLPFTQLTSLCTSSCVKLTRPSFTDVNRVWGGSPGSCNTSTDGGVTWPACTTQPFSSGGKENYAGASDGSVIGVAVVGGTTCTIKRSTDNGSSWNTVFSSSQICNSPNGSTTLQCVSNGSCAFGFRDTGNSNKVTILSSSNNGNTWSTVLTGVTGTGATNISSSLTYNGSAGVLTPGNSDGATVTTAFNTGGWAESSVWSATPASCWGSFIMNGVGYGVCYSGAGTSYDMRLASTGAVVQSSSLPGSVAAANGGAIAFSPKNNIIYMLASFQVPVGNLPIGIYVSQDGGVTYVLLTTTTTASISMREGDIWQSPINGCLYFSAGQNPIFQKLC